MDRLTWSASEKKVARRAFDRALQAELAEILEQSRRRVATLRDIGELWKWHDELDELRAELDRKYDYRYSRLVLVLGRLVVDGRLSLEDLSGLGQDKLTLIRNLVGLSR